MLNNIILMISGIVAVVLFIYLMEYFIEEREW